jgi:homoserine dehydrogenase
VDTVGIALLGYGTVGSGVGALLREGAEELRLATGRAVELRRVLELPGFTHPDLDPALICHDFAEIENDPAIQIVVELIGGVGPAFDFQMRALKAGKHVVTANKQLLAQQGATLLELADAGDVHLRFEASVCGAIPVIKVVRESLAAAEVASIFGIVNGTTNYILSAMYQTGAQYDEVLKQAQELGYAEADPTEDVTGKDAAAKMAILASAAFHSRVTLADVPHEGVVGVTATDIEQGRDLGLTLKLLGVAKLVDGKVNVRVYPAFLPSDHPLASVAGAFNAVFLESDSFDKIMLFGPGAGGRPTASAIIGDIISVVNTTTSGFRNCTCYKSLPLASDDDVVSTFYLRMQVADQPGVLARLTSIFGEEQVSIMSVRQTGRGEEAELVMVFHPVTEAAFGRALTKVEAMSEVHGKPSVIRVEGGYAG